MHKVLVVDDDASIRDSVVRILQDAGYECVGASDGAAALEAIALHVPSLIVLDIMMPGMDGFSVCSEIRRRGITVPIIFLSAKGDIIDKGIAFKLGGDDYLVKPFEPQELVFRVEALLRRSEMTPTAVGVHLQTVEYGDLVIDMRRHRVTLRGVEVDLAPQEFLLLSILAAAPGQVFTRDALVEEIWGPEYVGSSTSLTVVVRRIRTKIEDDPANPRYLQTVWRVGYRFGD